MKTIAVEETTLTAKELAALAQKEIVVLTRKGNPLVAVKDLSRGRLGIHISGQQSEIHCVD